MVGVDWPESVDMRNGTQYGLAAEALLCNGFPLKVQTWVAESYGGLGVVVGVAVAYRMKAEDRIFDFGWVLFVAE